MMARAYSTARFVARFLETRTNPTSCQAPVIHLKSKKDMCMLNAYRAAFNEVSNCITLTRPSLPLLNATLKPVSKQPGVCDMIILKHVDAQHLPSLAPLHKDTSILVLLDSIVLRSPSQAPLLQLCPPATTVHCLFRDMVVYELSRHLAYRHSYCIAHLNNVMQVNNLVTSVTNNLETWTLLCKVQSHDLQRLSPSWRVHINKVNMCLLWTLFLLLQPMKSKLHYSVTIGAGEEPSCVIEYTFKS